jgi:hypothetical protein
MTSAPFIIIGMHRSGTSFLAKVMERSGIFMGVVKDHNYEAMHTLSLNQQTLWAADYNWHKPGVPDPQFWKTIPAKELYREHFKLSGRWAYWKNRLINPAWGFKDPRNTFTLKMWLSLYPKAKVIHLHRDCLEITRSLQKRNLRKGEVHLPALDDSAFCQDLCEKYQTQAKSYKKALGPNYIEVSYQALIEKNKSSLAELSKFCGKPLYHAIEYYLR